MTRKEFLRSLPAATLALPLALPGQAPPKAETPAPPAPASVPPVPGGAASPAAVPLPKSPKKALTPLSLPPVQPGPTYLQAGPQLGHVSHDEARIWVRATAAALWKVHLYAVDAPNAPQMILGEPLTDESAFTGIITLAHLKPQTRYAYQVYLDGQEQCARPLPTFTTAPLPALACRTRIVLGSCVGQSIASAAPSWAELAARREMPAEEGGFDLLLMLGDNHYGNTTDLEKHRVYYTAHRLSAGWRDLTARTPVYAIWDDHDFGPNNSDGTSPGKAESLRAFREFWANPGCGEDESPGCYYTFSRGQIQFFMLDCRYHRSPNTDADGPAKTMLGANQLAWLKRELQASKARVKLLATGSEWESHSSEDSWARFRHERDAFFTWMEENKIEGVILLSGDRHFSAGYHIQGRYLEMSGGPFGSENAKLRPNPERFTGYDQGRLWWTLDIDTTPAQPTVIGEVWQAGRGRIEQREFTWAQLHGQEKIERTAGHVI